MTTKAKRGLTYLALIATVIIWGAGFVFSQMCLDAGLSPSFINLVRFSSAALIFGLLFMKRIKINRKVLLIGALGGVTMFGGFLLQLMALQYTTPAYNGFFTISYIVFVPFAVWIMFKRRPSVFVVVGLVVAVVGFGILNFGAGKGRGTNPLMWLGNVLTIGASLFFAAQILLGDYALHKEKLDSMTFVFVQLASAAALFVVYFLLFDMRNMTAATIDWSGAILPLLWLALLGTGFAYAAQTNAQLIVPPAEISMILSLEALLGTVFSIIAGYDKFSWHIAVGGTLVTVALLLVEVIPEMVARYTLYKLMKGDVRKKVARKE
jgi:drug/metabolite transporter (DMT)-like permease